MDTSGSRSLKPIDFGNCLFIAAQDAVLKCILSKSNFRYICHTCYSAHRSHSFAFISLFFFLLFVRLWCRWFGLCFAQNKRRFAYFLCLQRIHLLNVNMPKRNKDKEKKETERLRKKEGLRRTFKANRNILVIC